MKHHLNIIAIMAVVTCLLAGCTQEREQAQGYVKLEPTSSEMVGNEVEKKTKSDLAASMTWEQSLDVGKLIYQIDDVHLITSASEIGEGGFGEHSEIAFYDGAFYDQAMENWQQFGSQYEHIYTYPDYIQANGQFMDGAYMIALDMTVMSQDATNQRANPDSGELETRYGNPYLFKVDSILYLIDTGDVGQDGTYLGFPPGFFSEYGNRSEHPYAYELRPNKAISFRIGFLIGNRSDGTSRNLADLIVCTQNNSLDNAVWFDLNLEDIS